MAKFNIGDIVISEEHHDVGPIVEVIPSDNSYLVEFFGGLFFLCLEENLKLMRTREMDEEYGKR